MGKEISGNEQGEYEETEHLTYNVVGYFPKGYNLVKYRKNMINHNFLKYLLAWYFQRLIGNHEKVKSSIIIDELIKNINTTRSNVYSYVLNTFI